MKRVILGGFDPETNPTDAARSCVDMLHSDITRLRNLVQKWKNQIKDHPDDDTLMNKIIDESAHLQREVDALCDYYELHEQS